LFIICFFSEERPDIYKDKDQPAQDAAPLRNGKVGETQEPRREQYPEPDNTFNPIFSHLSILEAWSERVNYFTAAAMAAKIAD
jgi:hypothetical protein